MKTQHTADTLKYPGKKDGRGRPPTYTAEDRIRFAELIRQHGIRGTQRVAGGPICIQTLIKIRREFGIQLPKGARRRRAA